MPNLLFQAITLFADLVLFAFVVYYLLKIRKKEKELEFKENSIDTKYHQVVDDALNRERKIVDDAASEADSIISGAKYINKETSDRVNQTMQSMTDEMRKEAGTTADTFMKSYQDSLHQVVQESLTDFQKTTQFLTADFQKQTKEFHDTVLPGLQKELEDYKKARYQEVDKTIARIVQKVSLEVLNKSISVTDHENLLVESLEKAKKEGLFE
ncbi:MAG TPA: hypothetical protein VG965_00555 [Patescibacteria group bacterium]|nr:hypothetical protein [Patescibacteria group bacterium]